MVAKYTTLKLPKGLVELMDEFLQEHPEYTSRTDLVKEAVRSHLREHTNEIE